MTHNQIKMKSCVMLCYGMSREKPGKFQGGTDIFIWFLKDSTSFLLEKVEKRTQAKKKTTKHRFREQKFIGAEVQSGSGEV